MDLLTYLLHILKDYNLISLVSSLPPPFFHLVFRYKIQGFTASNKLYGIYCRD